MSCNACQTKFTFFTREHGCPSCHFSYCAKCLRYKFDLPDIGSTKICGKCYYRLKDGVENKAEEKVQSENLKPQLSTPSEGQPLSVEQVAPIDITQKLNSLENPSKPPIVLYKKEIGRWDRLKSGLDPADQNMVDRLRKLKDEDKPVPQTSLEEIRRRLALLKDQDPNNPVPQTNIHSVDTRSDEQKTADLINEYLEELKLSSDVNSDAQIEDRLARLRGIDPAQIRKNKPEDIEEDEQTATKRILKKALDEAAIESKFAELDDLEPMDTDPAEEEEELPWCTICNEDAQLRCTGCDGDLYCTSCFREGHDSFEMVDHQSVPFTPRKKVKKVDD
ncbi:abscission/NoCut checkpoint regulator [Neodiprion pinetum]|uniref:abscission/NoCut checkpoint regulator n=1 Tax=Neodiprion fabricii TaxID=2872261 RepID=UPI00076FAA6E|nr:abscission/NoCut checkpoint regulator [Neodiprion fabricii]XP_046490815.1 abscission/NoCut checkpoint regulator [Neodiprion pinetum]